MGRPTLIVFARTPAIGVGKTRLARDVGAVEAWRVYRMLSTRLLWRLRDRRWRLVVSLTGGRPDPAWPALAITPQGRGDLGQRLARALRAHAAGPVAVVGTDVPGMTSAHVAAAFRARSAIGPASDGGFWLLALDPGQARRAAFPGVRWSSSHALNDVAALIPGLRRLETLSDIDTGDDLRAWRRRVRS